MREPVRRFGRFLGSTTVPGRNRQKSVRTGSSCRHFPWAGFYRPASGDEADRRGSLPLAGGVSGTPTRHSPSFNHIEYRGGHTGRRPPGGPISELDGHEVVTGVRRRRCPQSSLSTAGPSNVHRWTTRGSRRRGEGEKGGRRVEDRSVGLPARPGDPTSRWWPRSTDPGHRGVCGRPGVRRPCPVVSVS